MDKLSNKADTEGASLGPSKIARPFGRGLTSNASENNGNRRAENLIKMELSDSQDGSASPRKGPSLLQKKSAKRPIINVDASWSSDEEDFAGFGDLNGDQQKSKKIKEEPLSDIESIEERQVKIEPAVKMERDTEDEIDEPLRQVVTPPVKRMTKPATPPKPSPCIPAARDIQTTPASTPKNNKPAPLSDPRYRKPFEFGWKRELVYRAQNDIHRKQYDKGEVYYITPAGKKLRTKNEILANLTEGLDANDFTFSREALGMGPDEEIIRSAKMHSAGKNRPINFLDLGEADPSLGFGKRVPKPKAPKGASPTPLSAKNRVSLLGAKKTDIIIDTDKSVTKSPKTPKAKGEPCTIQCVLAMGTIPQLQCKKCLCLFHQECVRRPGPVSNYICESCLHEKNEQAVGVTIDLNDSLIGSSSASTNSSAVTSPQATGGIATHTTTVPIAASATSTVSIPASASGTGKTSNRLSIKSGGGGGGGESDSTAAAKANPNSGGGGGGGSVIGGITTWMPPTTNLTTNRSELDINSSPPQSIAIVAGRKYIMVPKTNLMSVSPSGDVKIGDTNGMPLQYVDENPVASSKLSSSAPPTTGDDALPPLKKRLLSRRVSSKVHTPSSSPNARIISPAAPAKIATLPPGADKSKRIQAAAAAAAASSTAISTVATTNSNTMAQTRFASDFFNNVSAGYNVLILTFQYLKVQELLRASCVCRIWNQAAHNSLLWRTVRMKNSQVNDWSGLANTQIRNGTKHLDLRKMLLPGNTDDSWTQFSDNIGRVTELETIDLCRLPARVVENLFASNPNLRVLNAVAIKDDLLNLAGVDQLVNLRELRLKSLNSMQIKSLDPLQSLQHLRHLSLTSIKELGTKDLRVLGNLQQIESLELGECSEFEAGFAENVLLKLTQLERLRLEKGQHQCCTFEIIDAVAKMPHLTQLELVNFDINPEFDTHIKSCQNLKKLLIIPTYISQSATTNHLILNGVLQLADNLEQLMLVVTLELLRVTELYVDKCDGKRRDRKPPEDKIPVLKPVPGMSAHDRQDQNTFADVPQVEIVPLEKVEQILAAHLPYTQCSIVKVPYHATWRQAMVELQ